MQRPAHPHGLATAFALLSLVLAASACSDLKCPPGSAKAGASCKELPKDLSGADDDAKAADGGTKNPGHKPTEHADGGTHPPMGSDGGVDTSDGGDHAPDAAMPECRLASDCSSSLFDCVKGQCVQVADCDGMNGCGGSFECMDGKCVEFVPPERVPSGVFQSNGGGTATSAGYVLRLSVGMPQPMGQAHSAGYRLSAGPGAGRF